MDYLSSRRSSQLSNEPLMISRYDILNMHIQNEKDAAECRAVTESSNRGETYYANDGRPGNEKISDFHMAFFKEVLYRDTKTAGFMMEYPHGIVISQGERNSYFRGENQVYSKSQPSLYRALEKFSSSTDKELYRFIANMRIAEFGIMLCRLGIVQFWLQNYGSVLFEPLAQHYGLETEWLDITSDFDVALFFATCKWQDGKWQPLDEDDIRKNPNGVIFHIPQWQAQNSSIMSSLEVYGMENDTILNNMILPIGYQPFMRCHSQYAYGIHMKNPFPLQEDYTFEKLHFKHSVELSKSVFEMMDGGKKIYPQEGLDEFADTIEAIKSATTFSEEAFNYAFEEKNTLGITKKEICNLLETNQVLGKPVYITGENHPFRLSRAQIRRINKQYVGFSIEKAYGIKLKSRMVYIPPANKKLEKES